MQSFEATTQNYNQQIVIYLMANSFWINADSNKKHKKKNEIEI